ncbi:MAG TPA: UvrB/UvrC motif-containing protein, partial [Abditibacteriaceae bacterium]|nr:UvrB/UvrC motif-containing protein [Abditibacteriaceae bacterium]
GDEMSTLPLAGWNEALKDLPLDEIVRSLFGQIEFTDEETFQEETFQADANENVFSAGLFNTGEFPADEDAVDALEEDELEEAFHAKLDNGHDGGHSVENPQSHWEVPRGIASMRCAKCGTTWDRLRQDGRAGCVECYKIFEDQLSQVMERLQHAAQHSGKRPRTADKRRRRLEHLRARRDHRLAMLQRRLQEAVGLENYEEAAKIRDKIKMVSSTIVAS